MSINTNMTKKSPQLRTISDPVGHKTEPVKITPEATELEISVPMLLVIVAVIGVLIYGAIYFFGPKKSAEAKKQPETLQESLADISNVSLEGLELQGKVSAKYVFMVVSDFECPACQYFELGGGPSDPSLSSQIKKRYVDTGIMKYAFAPYILIPSHKPAATNETLGYYCALDQGKADSYTSGVFQSTSGNGYGIDNKGADRSSILALAKKIGVDEAKFTDCYDKRDILRITTLEERLTKEIRTPWTNEKGNYFGTPTVLMCKINQENPNSCSGQAFVGAFPFNDMKNALDKFLGADAPK